MATNDVNLQVINSMTQEKMQSLKDANGKIPSLANQIIMTDEEDVNLSQLRTEVVYDKTSSDSNKNWGITVGIKGGIVTESGDFTRYEYLKVTAWNYDTTITYFIDLRNPTPKEITSGYPYSGCGQVLSPVNITEEHYSFSAVSSDKKKFYHYKAGYIKDTTDNARQKNANYHVSKIEGYLKEPAMIYTGDELFGSDTVSIINGVIRAKTIKELWTNSSSSLGATTITLNSAEYDYLIILHSGGTHMIKKGKSTTLTSTGLGYWSSNYDTIVHHRRSLTYVNDTTYTVGIAQTRFWLNGAIKGNNPYERDYEVVPLAILGVKL